MGLHTLYPNRRIWEIVELEHEPTKVRFNVQTIRQMVRKLYTLPSAHQLRRQRRVFSRKLTDTYKIRKLEHGTLQLIDPEHLLEMRIQDIEEL